MPGLRLRMGRRRLNAVTLFTRARVSLDMVRPSNQRSARRHHSVLERQTGGSSLRESIQGIGIVSILAVVFVLYILLQDGTSARR